MWILFWAFLSILVGFLADSKRRNGFGWFFLSLIISPVLAFIILLVASPGASSLKKCPRCAEYVKVDALVCRFCNFEFLVAAAPTEQLLDPKDELKNLRLRYNSLSDKAAAAADPHEKAILTKELNQVFDRIRILA